MEGLGACRFIEDLQPLTRQDYCCLAYASQRLAFTKNATVRGDEVADVLARLEDVRCVGRVLFRRSIPRQDGMNASLSIPLFFREAGGQRLDQRVGMRDTD